MRSNLGIKLRFSSWPTALIGIVVIKAVLSLALKPGSFIFSYSGISYFLLLLLATGLAIRNGVQNTLGSRPFWAFLAIAYGLWALDQWIFVYHELVRHVEVPDSSIADPVLFLHLIPLLAAVVTLPSRNVADRKLYRPISNFLLLLFLWGFLYLYAVVPYQYLFPNATSYALRFDTIYLLENWVLVLAAGISSLRVQAPWKAIYLHLLGASILYALSSAAANIAIDSGGYVNGKLYGLGLLASVCWFVWIPLRARQLAATEAEAVRPDSSQDAPASAWVMLVVVMISVPVVWELFHRDGATGMRTFRLLVAVTAIVCLFGAAYVKEYFTKNELASRLGLANDRIRLAVEAGKSVGWDWDIKTGRDTWFGDLKTVFGIPGDTYVGHVEDFRRRVHPDDQGLVWKAVNDAMRHHQPYAAEFRIRWADGTVRWVAARGQFYYGTNGKPARMLGMAADITERKRAEEAVGESEQRFRLVADTAPVLIWMSGTDKLCTYFNKLWLDFTGRSLDQEFGNGWAEGVHPDDSQRCLDTYTQAFDRREEFRMEYRLRRHDGEYRWLLDIGVPRFDQDRAFMGYIGSCIDVTERKRGEEVLRESEQRLRLAAQAGRMYAFDWNSETDVIVRSEESSDILNWTDDPKCDTGREFYARIHQDDRAGYTAAEASVTPEKPEYQASYRVLRPDGSAIWLEDSGRAYFDPQGRVLRVIGMVADITERKRAEDALRESEERFHLAAQAGKMFTYEWDAVTDTLVRSPEAGEILGIEDAALIARSTGQHALGSVHADDRERLFAAVAALSPENPHLHVSYRMIRPDGKVIWLDRTSRAHFDEHGKILRIVGMATDITERKKEEQELALANDRLRLAMESGRSVGWEWDLKSGRDSWFGDLKSMFGVPSETFVGRTEDFYRYVHAEDRALVAKAVAEARESRNPYAAEFRVVWPDGTVRWVSSRGKFHYSPEGEPERMLGMAVDITEQRRTEASLRLFRELIDESSDAIEVVDPATLRFLDVNERACRDLGYTREEMLSLRVYDVDPFLDESKMPKHREELDRGSLRFDAIHRRKDGSTYPVEVNLKRVQLDRVYCVNVVRDITERKRSDEALRQKDADLTEAQRIAEVGSWQWETDTDTVIWSHELYRIAGRDSSLPAASFAEQSSLYTPESYKRLREAVEEAMRSAAPYQLDLEMIRPDGSIRWIKARGEAQRDTTGRVIRLRGTAQDITERKRVEEVLSGMNRKLIEAQEHERARIARELHDDLGQRLALLANEMEQLQQYPDLQDEVSSSIRGLQNHVFQIAADVQSLSHALHSSKLEYLGIAAAMRGFCHEFSRQQKAEIDFKSHDVPSPLPPEISLCLFRVLQEGLHNSIKHSGVRHVEVGLWGTLDEIHLAVSDSGAGFDSEALSQNRGLGLVSMEERLKLVKGTFSIESQPKRGTRIHASVPLGSRSDSMRAAG
jgi:PAS domain S-box-containing protein